MWKPSEAPDQFPVVPGETQVVLQPGGSEQGDGKVLVVGVLAVHQRHVQEGTAVGRQRLVLTGIDGRLADADRRGLGGE